MVKNLTYVGLWHMSTALVIAFSSVVIFVLKATPDWFKYCPSERKSKKLMIACMIIENIRKNNENNKERRVSANQ